MIRLVLLLLIGALTQVQAKGQEQNPFVLEAEEDNVKVYVRPESNGEMSVRVETSARTTVTSVLAVLDDAPNYPQWVHRCAEAYVVPGGTTNAYTYYSRLNLPFPLKDREVVAAIHQGIDPETGVLSRHITSTPDALPPTKGCNREAVYEADWVISPLGSGEVSISCTVRTAAGSGLPNWLRREIMTGGPVKTVRNLVVRLE